MHLVSFVFFYKSANVDALDLLGLANRAALITKAADLEPLGETSYHPFCSLAQLLLFRNNLLFQAKVIVNHVPQLIVLKDFLFHFKDAFLHLFLYFFDLLSDYVLILLLFVYFVFGACLNQELIFLAESLLFKLRNQVGV
jgi:hypothetical protein